MLGVALVKAFSRISLGSMPNLASSARCISTTSHLQFNITTPLCAEPMKKKKKVDPAIIKAREERRRKKIEKQIRRLQKNAQQLKPIDEVEVPLSLLDELGKRKRPEVKLTLEQINERAELQKQWAQYKRQEYMSNVAQVDRIMAAQKRALTQLYEESEELYNEAIQPDLDLLPYSIEGPVSTPPIKGYVSPDGEYIDVSKKWDN